MQGTISSGKYIQHDYPYTLSIIVLSDMLSSCAYLGGSSLVDKNTSLPSVSETVYIIHNK